MEIKLKPIATVKNSRIEPTDDNWGDIVSEITLVADLTEEALRGIEDFSHLEIVFHFDQADPSEESKTSRHPRGNTHWPLTGIFAHRGKDRPNHIGLCIAELIKREGKTLFVKGLDAINGTPVVDIKPVVKGFLPRKEIKEPQWSVELMQNYW